MKKILFFLTCVLGGDLLYVIMFYDFLAAMLRMSASTFQAWCSILLFGFLVVPHHWPKQQSKLFPPLLLNPPTLAHLFCIWCLCFVTITSLVRPWFSFYQMLATHSSNEEVAKDIFRSLRVRFFSLFLSPCICICICLYLCISHVSPFVSLSLCVPPLFFVQSPSHTLLCDAFW